MQRKNVTIGLNIWNKIQKLRFKEGVSWDQFFLNSIDHFYSQDALKEIRKIWSFKKKSKLYDEFLKEDRNAVILLLRNDTKKRLFSMAQDQHVSTEKIIENFFEKSPVVKTPVKGPELKEIKQKSKVIRKKKTRRPSGWKKKYQSWQIEAERWKWKPMESWIWPLGNVRILEDTTEEIDKNISQRLRTLFIYHLEDDTDDSFFRPYILEFRVEKRLAPGAPERIDSDAFHTIVYQYATLEELKIGLKSKQEIFASKLSYFLSQIKKKGEKYHENIRSSNVRL